MEEQSYASLNFQYDFIFARRLHSDIQKTENYISWKNTIFNL